MQRAALLCCYALGAALQVQSLRSDAGELQRYSRVCEAQVCHPAGVCRLANNQMHAHSLPTTARLVRPGIWSMEELTRFAQGEMAGVPCCLALLWCRSVSC